MVNFHVPFAALRYSHLLVRLIITLGIANLRLQVALLLREVVLDLKPPLIRTLKQSGCRWPLETTYPHADKVRKLGVRIDIHLDDTVVDGSIDFLLGRAGPTVEDKVPG